MLRPLTTWNRTLPGPHGQRSRRVGRQVGVLEAWSCAEAPIEYLRERGFKDSDIVRLRFDAVSRRGAVFIARKIESDSP